MDLLDDTQEEAVETVIEAIRMETGANRLETDTPLLQKILDQGWSITLSRDGELYMAFAVPSDHEDIKIAAADAEEDERMTDHPTVDQCIEWLDWKLST